MTKAEVRRFDLGSDPWEEGAAGMEESERGKRGQEMTVKRYSVTSEPDGYNIAPFDTTFVPGPVDVVLASDYDALAAQLAGTEAENSNLWVRLSTAQAQLERLRKAIKLLESPVDAGVNG